MKTKNIIKEICEEIISNKDKLTELDKLIGDADHGNNMSLGFTKIKETIDTIDDSSKKIMEYVGQTLMSTVGGASGPLYGMSFISGSQALSDESEISFIEFKKFVENALTSLSSLGGAKPGDKTMLDVWTALNEKLKQMDKLSKKDLVDAVVASRDSTKDMQAKKGRASYLGERSIGVIDPGSFSASLILTKLIEALNE